MAKRGRKRKGYFYEEQEQAVRDYLVAKTDAEKNRIFNTWLEPAFTKMIESLIRTYRYFIPDEDFDLTFNDTMSFLMTKLKKFDPNKGSKAYSYFGTVCKRHLMAKMNSYIKTHEKEEYYGDIHEVIADTSRYVDESTSTENAVFLEKLIDETCKEIQKIIDNKSSNISEDEKKVGLALIDIMQNLDEVFMDITEKSDKFNKTNILQRLKEETCLNTTSIRTNMKKYKNVYYRIKKILIEM